MASSELKVDLMDDLIRIASEEGKALDILLQVEDEEIEITVRLTH